MDFLSLIVSLISLFTKKALFLLGLFLVINFSVIRQENGSNNIGISLASGQYSQQIIMSYDFEEFPEGENNDNINNDKNVSPITEKPKVSESNNYQNVNEQDEKGQQEDGEETESEGEDEDSNEDPENSENDENEEESLDQDNLENEENDLNTNDTKNGLYYESLDHKNIPMLIEVLNDSNNAEILFRKDQSNFSNLIWYTPGAPRLFASYDFIRNNSQYIKKQLLLGEDSFALDLIILTPVQRQNLADELSKTLEEVSGIKYQPLASQIQSLIALSSLECSIEINDGDEEDENNNGKTILASKAQIEDMLLRIEFELNVQDEDRQIFVDMLYENQPVPVQCVYFLNSSQIENENNGRAFSFSVTLNENLIEEQTSSRFGQLENQMNAVLSENEKSLQELQKRVVQHGMIVLVKPQSGDFNKNGIGLNKYSGWFVCDGRNGAPKLTHLNQDGLVYIIYLGIYDKDVFIILEN